VSSVESIDGLNSIQLKHSSTSTSFPAAPQEMQNAYDATPLYANNINGKGINIAVASNYSFKQSDITTFLNYFNITGTNPVNVVNIDGTPTYNNRAGSDETTLDLESVLSSAPGAQITLYDGATPLSSTETDIFTRIVDDGTANVVTYSWGENESDFSPSQINALDSLFVAGSTKGMTFLVASGDNGSSEIDYPATDPYITCVGGTTLALNNSTGLISSEIGWSGSGGGASAYFPKPTWQSGIEGSPTTFRTIPDVASDADPNSGYMIYSNGRWGEVGGTSVAAPEWAGILALADQERIANGLGTLGAANSELYALANSGVYNDITSGSNSSYSCATGYDMVTGLGTPNVYKLVTALGGAQTTPVSTPTVPTGVTASAVSSTQVNLTWTAVPSATSYKIYRTTSSSLIPVLVGTSLTPTFGDTDLTKSTTYYYAVSAVGTSGESGQSVQVSATTLSSSSMASPIGLTAIPTSSSQINLSWGSVSGATSYTIYISTSPTGNFRGIVSTGTTSATSVGLSAGTTYYYTVTATGKGAQSPQSAVVSATTLTASTAVSSAPSGLTATPTSSSQINLSWTPVSGATSYKIYRSQSSAGTYTLIGTSSVPSYTSTALVQKTTYYYKVSAVNSSGEGPLSTVVSVTTLQAPILAKLSINGTIPALTAGSTGVSLSNTLTVTVSGTDQSGNSFNLKGLNITWTVPSSTTCATVSNGILTPVSAGSGTVYASVNGISSNSLTFTVGSAGAIAINSVQASNGMVLLYLNEVPKILPTLSQFAVAQSINGATAVVTKVIAGVERGNVILLQIARNELTYALQSVYDSVSYLGGTPVKSNKFTILPTNNSSVSQTVGQQFSHS